MVLLTLFILYFIYIYIVLLTYYLLTISLFTHKYKKSWAITFPIWFFKICYSNKVRSLGLT